MMDSARDLQSNPTAAVSIHMHGGSEVRVRIGQALTYRRRHNKARMPVIAASSGQEYPGIHLGRVSTYSCLILYSLSIRAAD